MRGGGDIQAGASFFLDVAEAGEIRRCEGDTFSALGLSPTAIEGVSLYDLISGEDVWLASDAIESVLRSGAPQEDRINVNDHVGASLPFRMKFSRIGGGAGGARLVRIFAMQDEGEAGFDDETEALESVADILADVERDLSDGAYDDPMLSIYALDADIEAEGADIDGIVAAADRMARSVQLAAEGRGRAFRVDRQTVSVLHGEEFDADAVSTRANEAAGPDYAVGRAAIDLADAQMDVQEKLDVIEKTITATRLAGVRLEPGAVQSPAAARKSIEGALSEKRTRQSYRLETAYSTRTGEPVLVLLDFANPMSDLGETPSSEEFRLALSLLTGRIEAAQAAGAKNGAPGCVVMDATMLGRLGRAAVQMLKPEVLILTEGVRPLSPADGQRFAAVFSHIKRAVVDGVDLAQSNALQRLVSQTGNVEFIRVPRDRFGDDPAGVAESFRQIAQLCARRDVSLYVNGIEDAGAAMQLREVDRICLGGPAVFPGLFQD